MVIISQRIINEFAKEYPLAGEPLNKWYKQTIAADWQSFNETKKTFNATDFDGNDRYVFDIGGNNYRLVAMIHFKKRTLYIRFIGTHKQYEQICRRGLIKTI
jgi:mRNA interferase HigB